MILRPRSNETSQGASASPGPLSRPAMLPYFSIFLICPTLHSEIREVQLQPVNPKFTTLARISVMALHRSIVGFLDSVGMWAQVRSGCGLKSFCGEVISRKIRRCLMRGRRLPSPGMRWCGTRRSRSSKRRC